MGPSQAPLELAGARKLVNSPFHLCQCLSADLLHPAISGLALPASKLPIV